MGEQPNDRPIQWDTEAYVLDVERSPEERAAVGERSEEGKVAELFGVPVRGRSAMTYGKAPEYIGEFDLDWPEYMHYLYLPVVMAHQDPGDVLVNGHVRLPRRLEFLRLLIEAVCDREAVIDEDGIAQRYVYVSARRGFASPGNPLNRPGWHADGFGTNDVNYIWTDAYPTRFALGKFDDISEDHVLSAEQFEEQIVDSEARCQYGRMGIVTYANRSLLRLDPFVVHATPLVPAPGGDRSFLKVSISRDTYNLRGNSHNYLFDYDWKMWARDEVRNDPAYAGGDAGPQA